MPTNFKYTITGEDDTATVTIIFPGQRPLTATNAHPFFQKIIEKAIADDPTVKDLFDPATVVGAHFDRIGDRVTVANNIVFYDGKPVDDAITAQIIRILSDEGDGELEPLVKFFEKVQENPNEHSREMLYKHLQAHSDGYTITPDGDFIGYKGVAEGHLSTHGGKAIVDGTVIEGKIPYAVGSIVEMRRDDVNHNPAQGCSTGLHVGTFSYAKKYGTIMLAVLVNPRDVVSVPNDASNAKMRVCRLKVAEVIEQQFDTPVANPGQPSKDAVEEAKANEDATVTVTTDAFDPAPWWTKYFGKRRPRGRR